MNFSLTKKQIEAKKILQQKKPKIFLLSGGMRSGKTFLWLREVILRCAMFPGINALVGRLNFSDLKSAIISQTLPKVLELCFKDLRLDLSNPKIMNKIDNILTLPNNSKIFFKYLSEKNGKETGFGLEFSVIFVDELSEIPRSIFEKIVNRCTEKSPPIKQVLCAENPDKITGYVHKIFVERVDAVTGLPSERDVAYLKINPEDNLENISPEIIVNLKNSPAEIKERFLYGNYSATKNEGVYAAQLSAAFADGRIYNFDFDKTKNVSIAFDLGYGTMSLWFFQMQKDKLSFIKYYESHDDILENYLNYIVSWAKDNNLKIGTVYLPHDDNNGNIVTNFTPFKLAREYGYKNNFRVITLKRTKSTLDDIMTVKNVWKFVEIEKTNCAAGLKLLQEYKYILKNSDDENEMSRDNLPDGNHYSSHCADAFRYSCITFKNNFVVEEKFKEVDKYEFNGYTLNYLKKLKKEKESENE